MLTTSATLLAGTRHRHALPGRAARCPSRRGREMAGAPASHSRNLKDHAYFIYSYISRQGPLVLLRSRRERQIRHRERTALRHHRDRHHHWRSLSRPAADGIRRVSVLIDFRGEAAPWTHAPTQKDDSSVATIAVSHPKAFRWNGQLTKTRTLPLSARISSVCGQRARQAGGGRRRATPVEHAECQNAGLR